MNNGSVTLSDRVQSLRLPDRPRTQPVGRWWLPWLLCLLLTGTTAFFAYSSLNRPPQAAETEEEVDLLKLAKTAAPAGENGERARGLPATFGTSPEAEPGAVLLESKGYIVPVQMIQVSPKVVGMVMKLNIQEGMKVIKGDILAELETVEYRAEFMRARATANAAWQRWLELASGFRPEEIAQTRAELDEMIAQKNQLFRDLQRNRSLQSGQAVSRQEYEQLQTSYSTTGRKVERLQLAYQLMLEGPRIEKIDAAWAEVMQSEADLTRSKWRLDNCIVRAPITGTILTKKAEEGNIVNPAAFNISASVCEMADLANLEVDLAIAERDISKLFESQVCKIRAEAFPSRVYQGWVSRLMPTADRAKGAVPVRVKIVIPREEAGQFLRPEMGALVTFLNARHDAVAVVQKVKHEE